MDWATVEEMEKWPKRWIAREKEEREIEKEPAKERKSYPHVTKYKAPAKIAK